MRFLAFLLAVCALQAQGPVDPPAVKVGKKIAVFNGKNLAGWYTWLKEKKYEDPSKVFSVANGMIRISGEEWGGLVTKNAYRDYHLIVEWKWGGKTWPPRVDRARDSGILVHSVGLDGAYNNTWLESIESQVIEGGSGDFILVGGKNHPKMTADVHDGDPSIPKDKNQHYWQKGGKPLTIDRGRFNWWGRDPNWQDKIGFRGPKDVEKPVGEWNRQEVICDGDTLTNILNGQVVNYGYNSDHTQGKIQLQSEGAEIYFRRVELLPVKKHISHR